MDKVYDRLGLSVVLGFEVDNAVPTQMLLERLSRVTVCTVSHATEDVDTTCDVENRVSEWVRADSPPGIQCVQLSVRSPNTQFLVFVWAHSFGDADYVLHHLARIFDNPDTLRQSYPSRGTHSSYGLGTVSYLYNVAVSLASPRVPGRTLRASNSFRLLGVVGTTEEWKNVAKYHRCSVNDVFVWMVKEAVSRIEGPGPAVITVVRNHRSDVQERNAHTHGMVVLPSTVSLQSMSSHTNGVKRCGYVLHPLTRALATDIATRLFTHGEQCTTVITSNVRVPWESATIDDGKHTVQTAFVTTFHNRHTVHLTSMNGVVRVCVSSRWAKLDLFCSTLSGVMSSVLWNNTGLRSTL